MQKWIRDRMRRRKKKPTEGSTATEVSPPLQPVYPDTDPEAESQPELNEVAEPNEPNEPTEADEQAASQPERTRPKRRRKKRTAKPAAEAEPQPAVADAVEDAEAEAGQDTQPAAVEPAIPVAAAEAPAAAPAPSAEQPKRKGSKGAVVLAVGLPGSGKSTWFKRHAVTPLSSDMVRHLLFDNATEQRYQDLVFGTLRSLLRARLIAKMPMNYVDATNLSPKERRHWIRMAKDFGYEAHAVYFDVPLEVCMDRNQRRNRVVPEDVMHRMSAKLRPPTFDEGFSKIIVVRVKPKAGSGTPAETQGE